MDKLKTKVKIVKLHLQSGDDEAAAGVERDLMIEALMMLKKSPENHREIATIALSTRKLSFRRW